MAGKDKQAKIKSDRGVFLLPGLYNETLFLLAQAHDYFYAYTLDEKAEMDNRERTMLTSEMSRITIRLSCVMTWLMARKAAFDRKITAEEANANYRLDCRDVCLNQHIEAESILPPRMGELLDKTYELYSRVARLDELNPQGKP